MSIASTLAAYAAELEFDQIPHDVVDQLKLHLIDGLGCALGAVDAKPVVAARAAAYELSKPDSCTLIGGEFRASVEMATFANSVAVRYLDYCDVYLGKEVTPPAATAISAFAMGEATSASGKACLTSLAVIYESLLRLCAATSLRRRGWDTVSFGAIASALGAARAFSLDKRQTEQALAIATVASTGLLRARLGELSMWKAAASANAARYGVFAAVLAKHGMTGPDSIFEGEFGLLQSVTGPFELPEQTWRSRDVMIKRYPAQVFTQTAIEAAISLSVRVDKRDIKTVDVATFKRAADAAGDPHYWTPTTRETADHSLPYVISAALNDGNLTPLQFDSAHLNDPVLFALMRKVSVHEDPELSRQFPMAMPARLRIECYSGQVEQAEVAIPFGHPARPMDTAAVDAKFMALAAPAVGDQAAHDLLDRLGRLESLDDLSPIAEILGAGAVARNTRHEYNVAK